MIHVPRDQEDESGTAIRPNAAWFERAGKRTATAIEEQGEHTADRKVYADPEVKAALEKLFGDKCAYCESDIEGFDFEVEHFRPSGNVVEREDHPGYYWLTYEWQNLYPSCQHCNQQRYDKPRWGDSVELPSAGKADQFPLLDESTRAMSPKDDHLQEDRLLIDPCIDEPEEYFGYDTRGEIFSVKDPWGCKTIDVFHLKRRRLSAFRRKVVVLVSEAMKRARQETDHDGDTGVGLTRFLKQMPHPGVARYVANNPHLFGV